MSLSPLTLAVLSIILIGAFTCLLILHLTPDADDPLDYRKDK
jgi:hypothetical protein